MMVWAIGLILLWALFNELCTLTLLLKARRLGNEWWTTVRMKSGVERVSFWATATRHRGSAFTFQVFIWRFVVLDELLLKQFPGAEVEAIVAHELGHCKMGHPRKRWWAIVSGAIFFKSVQQWSQRFEVQADAYAMTLCGFKTVDSMRRRLDSWGMARR